MNRNFRTRLRLLIVLSLLLFCLIGFAVGKYIMTFKAPDTMTVTFSNNLADIFEVRESKIERNTTTGAYNLTAEYVNSGTQTYVLIPGVDIEKDPYVYIKGKSEIPAYLYIEIVDTLDTVKVGGNDVKLINYSVKSDWEDLNKEGPHGGKYYRYKDVLNTVFEDERTYPILEGNKVTVSQHVKSKNITADGDTDLLKIYAYLIEIPPTSP